MAKNPLFSTYRAGENRVTSSMLAVFERLDSAILEQLLQAASGESTLPLVSFANQPPSKPRSLPDGEISGSFRYLLEVKTARNALERPKPESKTQIQEHLENLRRSFAHERLFVITPDPEEPLAVAELGDDRLVWFSFLRLDQAIDGLLKEPRMLIAEQSRYLLRELQDLFVHGLLGEEDTVVVAAREAYPEFKRTSAYICQANRSFRGGLKRLGFYTAGAIRPEVPEILYREDNVVFSRHEAEARAASGDERGAAIGELIKKALAFDDRRTYGERYQVFLLSGPGDERTLTLDAPIRSTAVDGNGRPRAWTQGQRYTRSDLLKRQPETTDELAEIGR